MGVSFARDKMFVSAVDKITLAASFKLETLKKKISNHTQLMQKQPTMKAYMQMLENVYNHASKKKIPLVFNAEEAIRQRSAAMTPA